MNTLTREKKGGYTQGAWEGKMYDPNLSTKEIAERVRFFFKKQYPTCKVSVQTQYYSGGSAIHIALMSAPFEILKEPNLEDAINAKGYYRTPEEKLESWKHTYESGHHQINNYYINDDFYLTEKGKEIIKFLHDSTVVYNFDDSDAQSDYFHTNFYVHLAVGKWDKPFKITK